MIMNKLFIHRIYEKIEHTGIYCQEYSSIAQVHKDIDAVVVQFVNTSGGYTGIYQKS